jgi:hypothetical protein
MSHPRCSPAACALTIGLLLAACSSDDSPEPSPGQGGSAGSSAAGQAGTAPGAGGFAGTGGTTAGGAAGDAPDASAGSGNSAGSSAAGADGGIIPGLGPALISVQGGFSIDATEVTRAQYAQWLATNPDATKGQPDACKYKQSFTPSCEWPPGAKGEHPVVCVDWCDARAFCAAGGKRLCGKIGGGPGSWNDFKTAGADQWYHACSAAGATAYPYGANYGAQTCNGAEAAVGGTWPAGSAAGCQSSAYQGLRDLSGNVLEWQDNCQADVGAGDTCRARGGSYNSGPPELACTAGPGHFRDDKLSVLGFRCCSP